MRIIFFKIQSVTTAEIFLGTKAMSKTLLTLRVSRVKNVRTKYHSDKKMPPAKMLLPLSLPLQRGCGIFSEFSPGREHFVLGILSRLQKWEWTFTEGGILYLGSILP